jgi:hypothetical protein
VVLLVAGATAGPALAQDGTARLGPFDVEAAVRAWATSGYADWNFEGQVGAQTVNVLSDLRWRGTDAVLTEVSAEAVWRWLVVSAAFGRGDLHGGVLIDDDFALSDRQGRFSHTRSSVEGDVYYVQGDLGVRVAAWGEGGPGSRGFLDLLAGYQHYHEHREAFGLTGFFDLGPFGLPVLLPNTAAPSLKVITHDVSIHSLRLGARARVPVGAGFTLLGRLYLLPWSSFELEDRHHLRSDLLQNPSFVSKAEGGIGIQALAGVAYTRGGLSVEAGWEVWDLNSGSGEQIVRTRTQGPIRSRLNEISIERSGPYLGVRYRF